MRILQLCNKPPLPKIDGGCIAIYNISEGLLTAEQDLQILTVSTEKHPFLADAYSAEFLTATKMDAVFVDTRVNIIDAFSALVTSDSYNISRFFSTDFDRLLENRLKSEPFDIVQLESLFMTPYISTIRRNSLAKIVLRSHNLEHIIWERLANTSGNQAKKLYLRHLASKLKTYEKRTINDVDGIAAISFEDTRRFTELKCSVPLITIPFGIDLKKYPAGNYQKKNHLQLFHIGAMNWGPNLEGINWFLDEIWNDLKELPVELHLGGREMPNSILKLADTKLKIYGDVPDAISFMQQSDVMVVPLLSGSGMRVKIIEGMALGKIVITTTVGAEGIDCENGVHLLIADTPDEFYKHAKSLAENPDLCERISSNARKLVESKYDNNKIILELISFYEKLLNN
ncbi:MAG: glycosyltransferase [Crocinitomicaceae bacterium]|nr:glycosyltransferase [Crocinitomicaceae bacterium]